MIHVVDDEEPIRDALAWLLRSRDLACRTYASAEEFLAFVASEGADPAKPAAVLLDVRMGGASGMDVFERVTSEARVPTWPVIFLTGHGDVPMAVEALKLGAFDFVEKPFNDNSLVDRLIGALAESRRRIDQAREAARRAESLASLTAREREVLDLIVEGLYNKVIADRLGIAMRTVEVYRARVFEKMGVKSAVELARMLGERDEG